MRLIQKILEGELPLQKAFHEYRRLRRGNLRPIEERYAKGIAKRTGIPMEKVLRSRPFKNYQRSLES